jgi:hypothetical protein
MMMIENKNNIKGIAYLITLYVMDDVESAWFESRRYQFGYGNRHNKHPKPLQKSIAYLFFTSLKTDSYQIDC